MAPPDVQKMNENRLLVRLFGDGDTYFKPQIPYGAMMRDSSHKIIFDKGYMPNWTKEHFSVSKVVPPRKGTKHRVYKLINNNDETVNNSWYLEEIQKISDNQYRIEKPFGGVLYLTTQKNHLSGGKVSRQVQLVNIRHRQVRSRR